ncbi:MAG: hypothetical protein O6918_03185 [Deltaproteobacteria bacterium]|nr:hypothetical protein [Deltaproteobacteria bacterium]
MKAKEMEPRPWDERCQTLEEFQRGHDEMGGAIAVRGFELEDDIAGRGAAHPFVAEGGARDIATQVFECVALMGGAAHVGMQAIKPCALTQRGWACSPLRPGTASA